MKESFSMDEEAIFEKLHEAFSTLADEFGGKTIFEITDIFMKVSGDMDALKEYLKRQKENEDAEPLPSEWNYIEDLALSMPENSAEYRDLLVKKGKEEIDKRKIFLLGAQGSIHIKGEHNIIQRELKTEEAAKPSSKPDVEMKDK